MEALSRWTPLVAIAGLFALATWNARRVGRRLGQSPVTVFRSPDLAERARAWLAVVALFYLAATGPFPALDPTLGLIPGAGAGPDGMLADPAASVPPPWLAAVGLALLAFALGLVWRSFATMGESWRIGVDEGASTELVTRGLYGRVRHPIYTAIQAFFLGLLALRPDLLLATYAVGALVVCGLQACREEGFLVERHGAEYAAYLARTGRFLPRLFT